METINIDGYQIAFSRSGKGPALILVHGFPIDSQIWNDVRPLLQTRFDVITTDLRGFGESSLGTTSSLRMEDYASDIEKLMRQLGIQQAYIAGHSMGGYVALAFAKSNPEKISGLGLVSSQVLADSTERKEGRYNTAKDVEKNGIAGEVTGMTPKFTASDKLQVAAKKIMEDQSPAAYICALKAMAERSDTTEVIKSAKYPVVLIHGEADNLIPIDRAREIKGLKADAKLFEIPTAGHLPMMEFPQKTANALQSFIET